MTKVEAPFNLDRTVTRWTTALSSGEPFTDKTVEELVRDTVHLAAYIYKIPVEELTDGEEIAWGSQVGCIGLNPDGNPWISSAYGFDNVKTLVERGANPTELATLVWKGALLKHRLDRDLEPYQESIRTLLDLP